MPLQRTLEPEVMDTDEDARDYDAMDHADVNARFCEDLLAIRPHLGSVLDVGTGTALIPVELCRRAPDVRVDAIDLAESMLAIARHNVERAGLAERIHLTRTDARSTSWSAQSFDAVVSNSIVHHIADPAEVLREMWRLLRPGGVLFVRDLERPDRCDRVAELGAKYAPIPEEASHGVRAAHARQRALFEASLHAALTLDELRGIAASLGIPEGAVRRTSDRHWTLAHLKEA